MTNRVLLISSFNLQNLAGLLENDQNPPDVEVTVAPFGQVMQSLIDPEGEWWLDRPDCAVIWTRPEDVIESYAARVAGREVSDAVILGEVDQFAAAITEAEGRTKLVLVPCWVSAPWDRGLGMLEMSPGGGRALTLMRMNLRLAEQLAGTPNTFVLDAQRWMVLAADPVNPKLWHMAKIPFGNEVFAEAARGIKAALNGAAGMARKLVVVDLDDTLWGGIVGDVGWQQLKLGGHDPHGEAFVDFQRALKALTRRGIVLGIVSKNEEATALEAIENNPEMVLGLDDFAGWRINWQDKAQNLADLVDDLNLGLQSAVFLDDNPVERARVRDALPEVLVPEMPKDPMLFPSTLLGLSCFDSPALSDEDRERARMYRAELKRKSVQREIGSLDEWLKTLETRVQVAGLGPDNLQRTVQLLNKTNQMNLRTRRLSEPELTEWASDEQHRLWTFRVQDRFGDSGLTGIASLNFEPDSGVARVEDFVLSCRVMGRKIEEVMVHTLIEAARRSGVREIVAEYSATPKNAPCLRFFESSAFEKTTETTFVLAVESDFACPEHVEVTVTESGTDGATE